ncbi:MAG TPA: DinB family protein, partial [Stellaceae bacterium]|nr:DinB family protein [Stellaceae bacterium]
LKESADWCDDFAALKTQRYDTDRRIEGWAGGVDQAWLDQSLTWFSGAANREISMPRGLLVAHLFNHQTHHRGQAHALITAAGEKTEDTDLFLVVPQVIA